MKLILTISLALAVTMLANALIAVGLSILIGVNL